MPCLQTLLVHVSAAWALYIPGAALPSPPLPAGRDGWEGARREPSFALQGGREPTSGLPQGSAPFQGSDPPELKGLVTCGALSELNHVQIISS